MPSYNQETWTCWRKPQNRSLLLAFSRPPTLLTILLCFSGKLFSSSLYILIAPFFSNLQLPHLFLIITFSKCLCHFLYRKMEAITLIHLPAANDTNLSTTESSLCAFPSMTVREEMSFLSEDSSAALCSGSYHFHCIRTLTLMIIIFISWRSTSLSLNCILPVSFQTCWSSFH